MCVKINAEKNAYMHKNNIYEELKEHGCTRIFLNLELKALPCCYCLICCISKFYLKYNFNTSMPYLNSS